MTGLTNMNTVGAQNDWPDEPAQLLFEWAKLRLSDAVGGQPHFQCWYSLVRLSRHMDAHGCTWMHMDVHGCTWMYMDVHGCTWMYMDVHGCTWMYMDVHGCTDDIDS